jgi:filamentous hemagglutinin family protein
MKFLKFASKVKLSALALAALLVVFSLPLNAFSQELPQNGNVVEGQADLDYSKPDELNVNIGSDKTIIDWNSFNIAAGHTVNYNRSSSFISLNRVTGADPSAIYGTINAPNGQIFLINPNGILFGAGSHVNAAGLIASTLDISNEDFMAGKYEFHKVSTRNAYVINQGVLSTTQPGGYICLLSGAVDNQNVVIADLGTVVLAAGEKMTLALDNNGVISVVIDEAVKDKVLGPDAQEIESAIKNSGTIQANGGKVIVNAKVLSNVFDYAINNTGVIQANNVAEHDGVIELIAQGAPIVNSGTIEAGKVDINVQSAPVINTGTIQAEEVNIKVEGADVVNEGSIAAKVNPAPLNFYQGNVLIQAQGLIQDGVVEADNTVTVEAQTITTNKEPVAEEASQALIRANLIRILAKDRDN